METSLEQQNKYVSNALKAVCFRLVKNQSEFDSDEGDSFHPEFVHQHFGENETFFGFANPVVELFYSACDLQILYRFRHEGVVSEQDPSMTPDNVAEILTEKLNGRMLTSVDEFRRCLDKQAEFAPFGELLHRYTISEERTFEIYKLDGETSSSARFQDFRWRMESFAYWFIDAASYTDSTDDRWHHYILYEKVRCGEERYFCVAGYAALYRYYAYPEHLRPRVGHILVLPPFRRAGHGVQLLQTIYNDALSDPKILDIAAEDPSDNFIRLRNFVDCVRCAELPEFSAEKLHSGFNKEMEAAGLRLKIPKKQIRIVYEILRLKHTDSADTVAWKMYRLEVKKRLNVPFQKEKWDFAKLTKVMDEGQLAAILLASNPEQRMSQLEANFQQTLEEYRLILNRLATYASINALPGSTPNGILH